MPRDVSVAEFFSLQAAQDEAVRRVSAHRADPNDHEAALAIAEARRDAIEATRRVAEVRVPAAAWDEHLAVLLREHEAGEDELARLVAQRRALGPKAADGDPEAVAAAAELVRRHADLMVQQDRRRLRIEEASERRRSAAVAERKAADEAGDLARRRAEAAEIGREVLAIDGQIDEALARMVAGLILRRGLALRLGKLGFPTNRMLHREIVTRAMRAAGLDEFCDLRHVSPLHAHPLAAQDRAVLPVKPDPTPDEIAAEAAAAVKPEKPKKAKAA